MDGQLELDEQQIRDAISRIDQIDFDKVSIEELEEILTPLFHGYKVTAPILPKGQNIWRGRICDKPTNICEITYPPPRKVVRLGRVNNIGESIFYGATLRAVPFFEADVKTGDHFVISKWSSTGDLIVNHIGFLPECEAFLQSRRSLGEIYEFVSSTKGHGELNSLVHDYLATIFSKRVKEEEDNYFKLTIALGRKLFKSELLQGLLYPTIAMTGNADNIAIKTDSVDDKLEFKRAEYTQILEAVGQKYRIQVLDSATSLDKDGKFLWAGRGIKWKLKPGEELIMKAESGEWVAYDAAGSTVDPT